MRKHDVYDNYTSGPRPETNERAGRAFFARIAACLTATLLFFAAGCDKKDTGATGETPPAPVLIMEITPRSVPMILEYVGQTAGSKETDVRAQVGGILLRRLYVEGDRVNAGDVLFQIDPAPYKARLDAALGTLGKAEATYVQNSQSWRRSRKLFSEQVIAAQEMDDSTAALNTSKAEVETAKADVVQARINLGYTTVIAPVSGVTSLEAVSEGSLIDVSTGSTLLTTITTLDPIYVNFTAPGVEIMRLRAMPRRDATVPLESKLKVDIQLADGTPYAQNGQVTYLGQTMNPQTGAIQGRAQFSNPDYSVLPGQYVKVFIRGVTLDDALLVPQRAVIAGQQNYTVLTVNKDDVVESKNVSIGNSVGNDFMILSGIAPGDRVIVDGIQKARPGSRVRPRLVEPGKTPDAGALETDLAPSETAATGSNSK